MLKVKEGRHLILPAFTISLLLGKAFVLILLILSMKDFSLKMRQVPGPFSSSLRACHRRGCG